MHFYDQQMKMRITFTLFTILLKGVNEITMNGIRTYMVYDKKQKYCLVVCCLISFTFKTFTRD